MKKLAAFFCFLPVFSGALADEIPAAPVRSLVSWLFKQDAELRSIAFPEVIAAATGKKVIAFDPADADDRRAATQIGQVMDAVLAEVNADEKLTAIPRINEVSSHFEDLMRAKLDAVPGFACEFPKTKSGRTLRSGYPDLRLRDEATGRIFYLDPKLYARGSRASSFRTFYFEPRQETNKVNDDAHHLIVGIEHDRAGNRWQFLHWELIDLATFRVHLKAEFEGANRDMYRPEAVVAAGPE